MSENPSKNSGQPDEIGTARTHHDLSNLDRRGHDDVMIGVPAPKIAVPTAPAESLPPVKRIGEKVAEVIASPDGTILTKYPGRLIAGSIGFTLAVITVVGLTYKDRPRPKDSSPHTPITATAPITVPSTPVPPTTPTFSAMPTSAPVAPFITTIPSATALPSTTVEAPSAPVPREVWPLIDGFAKQGLVFKPISADQFPHDKADIPEAMQLVHILGGSDKTTWKSYASTDDFERAEIEGFPPTVVVLAKPETKFISRSAGYGNAYSKLPVERDTENGWKIVAVIPNGDGQDETVYLQRHNFTSAELAVAHQYAKIQQEIALYGFVLDTIEYDYQIGKGVITQRITVRIPIPKE